MQDWLAHTYALGGIFVSIVGAFLTVFFSREARDAADKATSAAEAARVAADAARARILNVDLLFETTKISGLVDELHVIIGHKGWALVVDRANRIADSLSSIVVQTEPILSEESRAQLAKASTHFRSIATVADKTVMDANVPVDAKKLRKLVGEQKEPLLIAIEQLRTTARLENV
ncbi:hypothetical protein [Paracoccus fistulariae]|uniref:Uncharacterized protein n=1 Tax=Paracoccus fistulariae TaxID=658446 RepID=A0ABY7SMP5_9RHOB|nr:hypothetical protein [Paracoccus fistulariae]MDB6180195.1 hypothetical protein [Paracoccus fistulariae]WCR08281.1 hypothetical protein JHX87_05550 [Paracoccus fistulariae]